jgi:hypothetical protein
MMSSGLDVVWRQSALSGCSIGASDPVAVQNSKAARIG